MVFFYKVVKVSITEIKLLSLNTAAFPVQLSLRKKVFLHLLQMG